MTDDFAVRVIGSIVILGPALYVLIYSAHKIFMPADKFEVFVLKQTRLTRKLFNWNPPNIKLMRIVHIIGFIFGIICLLFGILGVLALWS